jgi:hypothetical protein
VYPDEQRDEASAIQWPESVPGHEPEYQSLHAHRLLSTPERAVIVWMLDEDEDAAMRQQIGRLRVTHTCAQLLQHGPSFGSPLDATVADLAIECFYRADRETANRLGSARP